jgi:hypothetical protein
MVRPALIIDMVISVRRPPLFIAPLYERFLSHHFPLTIVIITSIYRGLYPIKSNFGVHFQRHKRGIDC